MNIPNVPPETVEQIRDTIIGAVLDAEGGTTLYAAIYISDKFVICRLMEKFGDRAQTAAMDDPAVLCAFKVLMLPDIEKTLDRCEEAVAAAVPVALRNLAKRHSSQHFMLYDPEAQD